MTAPEQAPTPLRTRVLTAVVFGVVVLAVLAAARGTGLAVLLAAVCGLACAEFYALARQEHRKPNEVFGVVAAAALPLAARFLPPGGVTAVITLFLVVALAWHLAFRQITTADTAITVFGALYVGLTLSHLVLLAQLPSTASPGSAGASLLTQGEVLVLVTFVSVWVNDVFAYFVGVAVGKHKLSPEVSPKKSWEGFVGGAVCAALVWVASFSLASTRLGGTGLSLAWLAGIGVAVPVAALVGDLVESRFKREAGAKDSGGLLPGHGGFLDRFDSMIVVSVVVYYLAVAARTL